MARRPVGWTRKGKRGAAATLVRGGVAVFVRTKAGDAIRVASTARQAVRLGVQPQLARMMFRRERPSPDACDGLCLAAYSQDLKWVWCEMGECDPERCRCHLMDSWTDDDGPHHVDRGYPGPGWQFPCKPGHHFRCICRHRPA